MSETFKKTDHIFDPERQIFKQQVVLTYHDSIRIHNGVQAVSNSKNSAILELLAYGFLNQ